MDGCDIAQELQGCFARPGSSLLAYCHGEENGQVPHNYVVYASRPAHIARRHDCHAGLWREWVSRVFEVKGQRERLLRARRLLLLEAGVSRASITLVDSKLVTDSHGDRPERVRQNRKCIAMPNANAGCAPAAGAPKRCGSDVCLAWSGENEYLSSRLCTLPCSHFLPRLCTLAETRVSHFTVLLCGENQNEPFVTSYLLDKAEEHMQSTGSSVITHDAMSVGARYEPTTSSPRSSGARCAFARGGGLAKMLICPQSVIASSPAVMANGRPACCTTCRCSGGVPPVSMLCTPLNTSSGCTSSAGLKILKTIDC